MTNALLIPMKIDALCLPTGRPVREALVDYSKLPYLYVLPHEKTPHAHPSPELANISDNILSPPFSSSILELGAGIHLHWALPDALTHSSEQNAAGARRFPIVPNRFLVTRSRNGIIEKQWVVESDYLYPDLSGVTGPAPDAATVPFPFNAPNRGGPYQPFRYLGRKVDSGSFTPNDASAQYLGQFDLALTAMGPFEWVQTLDHVKGTFAAFYPGCRSVFGLHDDDASAAQNPRGLEYDVIGWYSNPDQDHLSTWYTGCPDKNDPQKLLADFNTQLGWQVSPGGKEFPRRAICYARLTFQTGLVENPGSSSRQVDVAIGSTGTEALSAYLAQAIDPGNKSILEEQLEALQFTDQLNARALDISAKLLEARHEKGFTATGSGVLWTVQKANPTGKNGQDEVTLPAALAHQLNQLNLAQQEYDEAADTVATLGERAFADWYKWMVIKHPQGDHGEPLAPGQNLESAFWTVAASDVAPARGYLSTTGRVQWQTDAKGQVTAVPCELVVSIADDRSSSWVHYLAELNNSRVYDSSGRGVWQGELQTLNIQLLPDAHVVLLGSRDAGPWNIVNGASTYRVTVDGGVMNVHVPPFAGQRAWALAAAITNLYTTLAKSAPGYILKPVAGPRFWQPNDPVVLMIGDAVQPSFRYGEDGKGEPDGLLPCQLLTDVDDRSLQDLPHSADLLGRLRAVVNAAASSNGSGFASFTEQPWNPFMMEWETQFFPNPRGDTYAVNYLTDNYTLAKNASDLSLVGEGNFETDESPYHGFAILSPHASLQIKQRIAGYLGQESESLPSPHDVNLNGVSTAAAVAYLDAHAQDILDHYTPHQSNDPVKTALQAYVKAKDLKCLSQALGGFNDALVMKRRIMQLDAADPLSTGDVTQQADSMLLGTQVAGLMQNTLTRAPVAASNFTPIRAGELRISALNLIDSFGQVNQLTIKTCVSTELMPRRSHGDEGDRFLLPPRFTQPARLSFRWLSALPVGREDDQEMNAHPATSPICGWVLPNFLDSSLMIYRSDGALLGLVNSQGWWQPAPGRPGAIDTQDIANPHLKAMVGYLVSAGAAGADFMSAFLSVVENALEQIEPETFGQHQGLSLLVGRPLALVRAAVGLELQGLPARDNSWKVFLDTVKEFEASSVTGDPPPTPITANPDRFTHAFQKVMVPVRIGEYGQLNDGVVGYWKEAPDGSYQGETFFAPQSGNDGFSGSAQDARNIVTEERTAVNTLQSVGSSAQVVTMLIDPRGVVHATSGVAPTKAISIPPDQFTDALAAIEVTFLSAPILTASGDYNAPGTQTVHLSLPIEPGYAWSWLSRQDSTWSETTGFAPMDAAAKLGSPQQICDGWLKLSQTGSGGSR